LKDTAVDEDAERFGVSLATSEPHGSSVDEKYDALSADDVRGAGVANDLNYGAVEIDASGETAEDVVVGSSVAHEGASVLFPRSTKRRKRAPFALMER